MHFHGQNFVPRSPDTIYVSRGRLWHVSLLTNAHPCAMQNRAPKVWMQVKKQSFFFSFFEKWVHIAEKLWQKPRHHKLHLCKLHKRCQWRNPWSSMGNYLFYPDLHSHLKGNSKITQVKINGAHNRGKCMFCVSLQLNLHFNPLLDNKGANPTVFKVF